MAVTRVPVETAGQMERLARSGTTPTIRILGRSLAIMVAVTPASEPVRRINAGGQNWCCSAEGLGVSIPIKGKIETAKQFPASKAGFGETHNRFL